MRSICLPEMWQEWGIPKNEEDLMNKLKIIFAIVETFIDLQLVTFNYSKTFPHFNEVTILL